MHLPETETQPELIWQWKQGLANQSRSNDGCGVFLAGVTS